MDLATSDLMGNKFYEEAVLKTFEEYYPEYQKKKNSNKNTDTDNALTGSTSSTASGGSSLPPDDDKDKYDQTGTPPKTLQSGGNTINQNTADKLNQNLGTNYHRRDWGSALEELKKKFNHSK